MSFEDPMLLLILNKNVVWCIKICLRDCNAMYVGETGRSVKTRKREHAEIRKREHANRCDGVVARASASQSVDLGFIP